MQFLLGIFCFFIFFYSLYILSKDDYVLIRKNVSSEQLFDFAFFGTFAGIVTAWIIAMISRTGANSILVSSVFGFMIVLYLISVYRKLPAGRLLDFFSLALLSALPLWYLVSIFFVKRNEIVYYLFAGIFYLGFQLIFWKFLLPRLIKSKLREGSMCSLFLLIFSCMSFFLLHVQKLRKYSFQLEPGDFILMCVFISGFIFLLNSIVRRILRV